MRVLLTLCQICHMSSGIMMSSMQYICSVYVMFRLHDVRYVMRVLLTLCQICHMSSGIMMSSMQYICHTCFVDIVSDMSHVFWHHDVKYAVYMSCVFC